VLAALSSMTSPIRYRSDPIAGCLFYVAKQNALSLGLPSRRGWSIRSTRVILKTASMALIKTLLKYLTDTLI